MTLALHLQRTAWRRNREHGACHDRQAKLSVSISILALPPNTRPNPRRVVFAVFVAGYHESVRATPMLSSDGVCSTVGT